MRTTARAAPGPRLARTALPGLRGAAGKGCVASQANFFRATGTLRRRMRAGTALDVLGNRTCGAAGAQYRRVCGGLSGGRILARRCLEARRRPWASDAANAG